MKNPSFKTLAAVAALCAFAAIAQATLPVPDPGLRLADAAAMASAINGDNQYSFASGQTALGTTQATAFNLVTTFTEFTTTPASSGATLPVCTPGTRRTLSNAGANALQVYTNPLEATPNKINATAGATGVSLAAGSNMIIWCPTAGQWYKITGN